MKMTDTRLLIAAGEVAADAATLPPGVRTLIESAKAIHVIAPRLPDRFEWLASATDISTQQADERLSEVLSQVKDAGGSEPSGEVGADDPLLAFEDAVRSFGPNHILIGLRTEDRSGWQERGLLDAVQERFGLPLTVFQVPGD
jgi:hypothetical protein